MSIGRRGDVLRSFQTLFAVGSVTGLSDGELLERSLMQSGATSEVAFAALVERHGPMVLRVCRKALGDPHEAHDAFQSTFLILARKAEAIRSRDSVASWLHGVALRVSAASRASTARRKKHERVRAGMAPQSTLLDDQGDLGHVLHDEVGRLPSRYREAVVLCYLEGKSYEEAAGCLHVPVGTVKSRLSWARERLRSRLVGRGFAPAAGAIATILSAESAQALVPLPAFWVETTTDAAFQFAARSWGWSFAAVGSGVVPSASAVLAKGVIHAMVWNKIKLAGMAGAVMMGASGLGVVAQQPAPASAPALITPMPLPSPLATAEGDRLDKLESKLDRLISVLEKTMDGGPARPAQSTTTQATTLYRANSLPKIATGTFYAAPATSATPATITVLSEALPPAVAPVAGVPSVAGVQVAPNASFNGVRYTTPLPAQAPVASPFGRVASTEVASSERLTRIEERLAALEKKMEKLAGEETAVKVEGQRLEPTVR